MTILALSDEILLKIQQPARYIGNEVNMVKKDPEGKIRVVFGFPDVYEIGMSHIGMQILCHMLNQREDAYCERVFSPWPDLHQIMKEQKIPLFALETQDPIRDFDFFLITLQYEMAYPNILQMLDLAGIPFRSKDRTDADPIVVGGGPCTYNAEPIADYFDLFMIGEGEEVICELVSLYKEHKKKGFHKSDFLHDAAKIEGIYVPSLYEVSYHDDGTIAAVKAKYEDIPVKIKKRIVKDMDKAPYPKTLVMPFIQTVQDKITLEVYRGCIRGCRFCQAGMVWRPVREKSPEVLCQTAMTLADATGYDEMTLSSLSISDYSCIEKLTDELLAWTDDRKISLSLPSLRVDSFTKELMDKISTVRTGSLTFAPEAGTQRLRDVINKNVREEDLMRACRTAFEGGKSQVKLYFMQGLPTETNEDLDGIAELAEHVIEEYYHTPGRPKKSPGVTISAACFIPKPFTPFQWEPQCDMETLLEKQKYLTGKITDRRIKYNYHDARVSRIEAVFARGDRKLNAVLAEAHRRGMRFDSWDEHFDYNKWMEVFDTVGIDPAFYANREFAENEIFPWDNIDIGVSKAFLLRERHRAYEAIPTKNCRESCSGCGADRLGGERSCCPSLQK